MTDPKDPKDPPNPKIANLADVASMIRRGQLRYIVGRKAALDITDMLLIAGVPDKNIMLDALITAMYAATRVARAAGLTTEAQLKLYEEVLKATKQDEEVMKAGAEDDSAPTSGPPDLSFLGGRGTPAKGEA